MLKIDITTELIKSLDEFVKHKSVPRNEILLTWIGQAGFIMKFHDKILFIDPYLSNYLSKKYQGKLFPHIRLMGIPLSPEKITNVDYVFSTHPHSDHMDPETLSVLSQKNPNCRFIIPAAAKEEAIRRGIQQDQIISAFADKYIQLGTDFKIKPIPAAHESLEVNENEEHFFLGFIFFINNIRIYHSGDCVPYYGLNSRLNRCEINLALLPINGRDEYRLNNGIAGNFLTNEAIEVCRSANIENLLVHHFGMFAYNTVSEQDLDSLKTLNTPDLSIFVPEINKVYRISKN